MYSCSSKHQQLSPSSNLIQANVSLSLVVLQVLDDDDVVYYYICQRLKLEGETENMGVCTKVLCDDDVYYYIRWRLKLEGETENMGVCGSCITKTEKSRKRGPKA